MILRKLAAILFLACATISAWAGTDSPRSVFISIPDQRLVLLENGKTIAKYPVSTSRYGVGDSWRSYCTPLGTLEVVQKIGANAPLGGVFKHRQFTGEVLQPNAAGRDPIVTRIMWLNGMESGNQHAYQRGIYIHGTPVENLIGQPASYGCIRMRSKDVAALFDALPVGTKVTILAQPVRKILAELRNQPGAFTPKTIAATTPAKPAVDKTATASATAIKSGKLIARAN